MKENSEILVSSTIYIPNVTQDERIGSVFNHLFRVIWETEQIVGDTFIWDFRYCNFLHSSFLLLLSIFYHKCEKTIYLNNIPHDIQKYLDAIYFETYLDIEDSDSLMQTLQQYADKSYIPICRFRRENNNIDEMQTIIQQVIERQTHYERRMQMPISYLMSELISNISEHSYCKSGYLFSQYHSATCMLDIGIIDDGITIYGSYVRTGKYLDEIGSNEGIALQKALSGYSTKDLPGAETRGYGISTTVKMITEGLHGAVFIFSGGAFCRHSSDKKQVVNLPSGFQMDGTAILLRIPVNAPDDFQFNKFIE